ncbi:lymphoid-specific helicase-like, partial [Ceratina calcarata]|uniref:Lymphoid-specific helicase-like n=1 Tax=Ceratina calcarata TaxID=156304 RepID=A0AAJ7JA14_9HYME
SKFYASYIGNKISNHFDEETDNKTIEEENKENYNNENISLQQKRKKKDKIENHISKNVQEKIQSEKNKINLHDEEVPNDSETQAEQIDNDIETPKYFNGELREYQKQGFQWLKVLYENGINGMLADEMGLGKTIQIIALLCHLIEKRQNGPYLLVVPLSTVPNWLIEFERFAPKLPVVLFHGAIKERQAARKKINQKYTITLSYSTLPIVLTTYEVAMTEHSFLKSLKWRYIIVDEGHKIKNYQCQLIKC